MSMSLASAATSFSSAADMCLFAPSSPEDAVHAVPALLSQLLSGRTDEQVRFSLAQGGLEGEGWRELLACLAAQTRLRCAAPSLLLQNPVEKRRPAASAQPREPCCEHR
jgi:hypothetical protein